MIPSMRSGWISKKKASVNNLMRYVTLLKKLKRGSCHIEAHPINDKTENRRGNNKGCRDGNVNKKSEQQGTR